MYEYIRCPTCNESIGEFYQAFQEMKKLKKIQTNTKKKSASDTVSQESYLDIFEILHIQNYCCRTRLSTVKRFNDTLYEDYNE